MLRVLPGTAQYKGLRRKLSMLSNLRKKISDTFSVTASPKLLLDSSTASKRIHVITDSTVKGKSTGSVELLEEDEQRFVRLQGMLDTEIGEGFKRSGFCNFRYTLPHSVDLTDYKGLHVELRTDGR